ncbi:PREDICTED: heat shock protein 23-like [Rhagoletis zephyria]|uniref:heat shock protein 23-like n=1 Tax=Rhagoletis zephyria TaxID=28612 RepID=UPI0008117CF5|nr:PREDICTED: heat shock protein 23-like [Rhagoletis zephyria]XP_017464911.1 PREDICTED: heat shock protein 23-like [Rhagoletis zephyria]XP_017464913.1 PREDICTED: heat shock protein 23-like [Rhagoletis zephyria]
MASPPLLLSLIDDLSRLTPFYEPVASTDWPAIVTSPSGQFRKFEGDLPVTSVGKDGFQASMNVQQFKPSELSVKVVDDHIVVEGKHEERADDHGYISRHFIRRFEVPKGFDAAKMVSTLSSDGVLTVSVPNPAIEDNSNKRVIQIKQTIPALRKKPKDNPKENPKE